MFQPQSLLCVYKMYIYVLQTVSNDSDICTIEELVYFVCAEVV